MVVGECPTCDGSGIICDSLGEDKVCPKCKGTGKV